MDILQIVNEFFKIIKDNDIISIGSFDDDLLFIEELVNLLDSYNKKVLFIPTNVKQAKKIHDLSKETISLNDKEIDVAIEFVDQFDQQYYNFIKSKTNSFIRDKMICQSALNLVIVVNDYNVKDSIDSDIYVEISTFAWERTILNLQSFGLARIVMDLDGNNVKTEIGHYIARITLDKNISLEDFEYTVRNIPGVLETGLFIGLADTMFIISKDNKLVVKSRGK